MHRASKGRKKTSRMTEFASILGAVRNRKACLAVCIVLTLGGVFGLTACDKAKPRRATLVVGTNVWPGYEPLYLARELRFYDNLEVRIVEYSSATQVLRAFRNGTIHVAALTLDEALLLRESGVDVCAILVTDISDGADVILAAREIDDLKSLKGKRVGVENTALGAYVLARALQSANIPLTDITIVSREIDEHEKAVAKKEVDAIVTFEPVRSRLIAQGMTEVFDSSMIPGEIVDLLVVRRGACKSRSGQLVMLLDGWFKALQYLEEQPESAAKYMAPRLQIKPDEVLAAYDGLVLPGIAENMEILDGPAPSLDETVGRLAKIMSDLDLLDPNTELEGLGCPDILTAVGARGAPRIP